MGIAANQARLMTLTARQSDLEYKAQQLSAIKMRISQKSSDLALQYADALSSYSKLNTAYQLTSRYANDANTKFSVSSDGTISYDDNGSYTAQDAYNAVCRIVGAAAGQSPDGYLTFEKEHYDTSTAKLSAQEKMYDMDLTQVNTEHDAIKTEFDAIKSLVGDNVEKSFNVFG